MPPPTRAFTLFEVAVSLAIMTAAIVSCLMLFPQGLRAQRLTRFRLYASAKAVELVESWSQSTNTLVCDDIEAPRPWDVPVNYRATAPDLEARVATRRFGAAPMPTTIARRLDSDGDELRRILDEGGEIYYSLPQAPTAWDESALPRTPPSDAQSLVFAVSGFAQANALFSFPCKAWPYYTPFPAPPMVVHHAQPFAIDGGLDPAAGTYLTMGMPSREGLAPVPGFSLYAWEETCDPDVRAVLQWPWPAQAQLEENYGWLPYAYPREPYDVPAIGGSTCGAPTRDGAVRYLQAALWYAKAKQLPSSFWSSNVPLADFVAGVEPWKQVEAIRFLSHAATCLTRWYTHDELVAGVPIAGVPIGDHDPGSPALTLTEAHVIAFEESALALMHRYRTTLPYDWTVPRSYENAVFTDWPLLEPDLFGPPLTGDVSGAPGVSAAQWRPIPAQTVTGVGRSMSYPGADIPASIWGDASRFTLTAPFAADERCRQLVFWAVDWRSYEDCDTAPSAPVDASRYPKVAPLYDAAGNARPFTYLIEANEMPWVDLFLTSFRNPELACAFTADVRGLPTGAPIAAQRASANPTATPDRGRAGSAVFTGAYGADRDYDGVLTRGPVPATARLRATTVARFNYYDARVPWSLR